MPPNVCTCNNNQADANFQRLLHLIELRNRKRELIRIIIKSAHYACIGLYLFLTLISFWFLIKLFSSKSVCEFLDWSFMSMLSVNLVVLIQSLRMVIYPKYPNMDWWIFMVENYQNLDNIDLNF